MKRSYVSAVVKTFLSGHFPFSVEKQTQQWLMNENFREEKDYSLQEWWNHLEVTPEEEMEHMLLQLKKRIETDGKTKKHSIVNTKFLLRIAAVLLPVCMLAGIYFYNSSILNNSKKGMPEEIVVPSGDQDYLVLMDGTEVWLNAGSVLRYSAPPDSVRQQVELKGEAYFHVKNSFPEPFTVRTKNFMIEAIGTSFNVWDYPEEDRGVTTLDEGALRITTRDGHLYELNPNEQLIYEEITSEVKINPVENPVLFSSWRKDYIVLEGLTLEEVFRTLERNLDITIHIAGELETEGRYVGKLRRSEEVTHLMEIMNYLSDFSYQIKDKEVFISPGSGPR